MKRQRLDEHIDDYYRSRALRPEVRERLRGMAEVPDRNIRGAWSGGWAAWAAGFAAAALVFLAVSALMGGRVDGAAIAAEIAANYNEEHEGMLEVTSLAGLNAHLSELDFDVIPVETLAERGAVPIAARYCSLDGQIAVQVTVDGRQGERLVLYQAKADGRLAAVEDGRFEVEGVTVELWKEAGVLVGLASRKAPR